MFFIFSKKNNNTQILFIDFICFRNQMGGEKHLNFVYIYLSHKLYRQLAVMKPESFQQSSDCRAKTHMEWFIFAVFIGLSSTPQCTSQSECRRVDLVRSQNLYMITNFFFFEKIKFQFLWLYKTGNLTC